jgi:D-alanyl-D-alanine carboxypeptidase
MQSVKILYSLFLIVLLASCATIEGYDCQGRTDLPTTSSIDQARALRIAHSICDCLDEEEVPAIQVSIIDSSNQVWTLTTGTTDKERTSPANDNHRFRLASITKSFIAVLTFQLIEEGKIRLDTKVSAYFPDYGHAEKITLAHLLNHSSGIKDLLRLPDVLFTSTSNTSKIWNPYRLAETVMSKDLRFEPGTDNQYSNSNYLLLGLIAKEVTGKELDILLDEKLFAPLGLTTFSFHPVAPAPSNLISGYDRKFIPKPGFYELKKENTSFSSAAYASGNLIATSEETARFFHALFSGQVISAQSLAQMESFTTLSKPENAYLTHFGSGLFEYDLNGEAFYGHEGQFIGFDNVIVHSPKRKMTIVMLSNVSVYEKFDLLTAILLNL